jgi:hypothetical protein
LCACVRACMHMRVFKVDDLGFALTLYKPIKI